MSGIAMVGYGPSSWVLIPQKHLTPLAPDMNECRSLVELRLPGFGKSGYDMDGALTIIFLSDLILFGSIAGIDATRTCDFHGNPGNPGRLASMR